MGSWLLTRETCAALASILTTRKFVASEALFNKAGMLLISTLTSLKHAGAAFAAHRALQQISEFCFSSTDSVVAKLPVRWAQRLVSEMSEAEKVRDSTLRRSTGLALGFLAIMRSEMSSKADPRTVCHYILSNILKLSLPPKQELGLFLKSLELSTPQQQSVFSFLPPCEAVLGSQSKEYEVRHLCASDKSWTDCIAHVRVLHCRLRQECTR